MQRCAQHKVASQAFDPVEPPSVCSAGEIGTGEHGNGVGTLQEPRRDQPHDAPYQSLREQTRGQRRTALAQDARNAALAQRNEGRTQVEFARIRRPGEHDVRNAVERCERSG
jgi:hypothetical protein